MRNPPPCPIARPKVIPVTRIKVGRSIMFVGTVTAPPGFSVAAIVNRCARVCK